MGACDISFKLKGKATRSQIEKALEKQRKEDRSYNGSQGGYSGDFQTVNGIRYDYLGEVLESLDKAYDFALSKAEKWEYAVAVYFTNTKGEVDTLVAGWGAC